MAKNATNATTFKAEVFGQSYVFTCREVITRDGLTHVCRDNHKRTTRVVWGNRPWEGFKFEAVLKRAIAKCPRDTRPELERQVLTGAMKAEEERMDAVLKEFQKTYDSLSDHNKEIMKNYPMLQTEEDARRCIGFMKMLALFQ